MPNVAYTLIAHVPQLEPDGHWWWVLQSERPHRHGPFATEEDALSHRERRFGCVREKARRAGGWGWRSSHTRWHVLLPEHTPCRAPRMEGRPCSVHQPLPGEATNDPADVSRTG